MIMKLVTIPTNTYYVVKQKEKSEKIIPFMLWFSLSKIM